MQEPLAGLTVSFYDACPCRAAEVRLPVVGWLVAVGPLTITEDEHVPLRAVGAGSKCCLEIDVLVRTVVGDEVRDDAQVEPVGLCDEASKWCRVPKRGGSTSQ